MHLHAEHALFFERRQPLWVGAFSLGLTVAVLVANAGAQSAGFSFAGAGVGAVLLFLARARGRRRIEPALVWTLTLVVLASLAGVFLDAHAEAILATGARVLCGVVWILWLGSQLDWALLRALLLRVRVPEAVVASLDHAILHGVLTQREWVQRRDAARIRLGRARLPLSAWGPLLGEGALHAFSRLERTEESALLRSASSAEASGEATADADSDSIREASGEDTLELDGVDVERGEQLVLEELHLRLRPSELLLVCGPSGAGKSSLLRLLAGLDPPARGTMNRLGRQVQPGATLRASLDGRVVLLCQNPQEHFIASTVAEDIAWGLVRRGLAAAEAARRSREVALALRIAHLLDRPCHQLSFGEQRRVALAGLLVLEPTLLLLDEPTTGLDPVAAAELRALVDESLRRTGAACVWATHDLHSLPPQSNRVVLLRDRRVIYDGLVAEGLSQPWLCRAGLAAPQDEEEVC